MRFMERGLLARVTAATGLFVLSLTLTLGATRAQDKTYVMKMTTATVNAYVRNSAPPPHVRGVFHVIVPKRNLT